MSHHRQTWINSHWVEHDINLPIAGLPGTRALCDALVHVLLLVKIDNLWIETLLKINQNWYYQIETETCSRQRRLEVFTIFTFSKLAVERETVSIRGTGKVLKVPEESTFLLRTKGIAHFLSWIGHLHFRCAISSIERASFDGVIELVANTHPLLSVQSHVVVEESIFQRHALRWETFSRTSLVRWYLGKVAEKKLLDPTTPGLAKDQTFYYIFLQW